MFLDFFYTLRARGIAVTPIEWLSLCEVVLRHPSPDFDLLYRIGRSLCVKHEWLYDAYDQAFSEAFGLERSTVESSTERMLRALADASPEALRTLGFELSPELLDLLTQHRDALAALVAEPGVEVEGGIWKGEGGKETALRVARQRRFRNYRSDVVLDTRGLRVALSRLRLRIPEGPLDELDVERTIADCASNGGEIELRFRRRKKNRVRLILLMDAGGTMTPHAALVNRLFSAARGQFADLKAYYFHNCPYQVVYEDIERRTETPTEELLRLGEDYRLVLVGDAHMHPRELVWPRGAVEGLTSEEPGLVWLQRLRDAFPANVWLNPVVGAADLMSGDSVSLVQSVFPMYPLTIDGLDEAMQKLMARAN